MSRGRRRILLTNDDGIDAAGLLALLEPLSRLGELTVVAPVEEQSGVSHSIVYRRPVVCERRTLTGGIPAFAVDAFPTDCVKLAFDRLLGEKPDLVVSGIKWGANIGSHLFYSGTVAAAIEASIMGVTGLAVSLVIGGRRDFGRAVETFLEILGMLDGLDVGPAAALNINVPPVEVEIRGIRWAAQSSDPMPDAYEGMGGPDGRRRYQMRSRVGEFERDEQSDRSLLQSGYVTVTPLRCDLTCRETLARLQQTGGTMLSPRETSELSDKEG